MKPVATCKTYLEAFGQKPTWGMDGKAYRYKSFMACKERIPGLPGLPGLPSKRGLSLFSDAVVPLLTVLHAQLR